MQAFWSLKIKTRFLVEHTPTHPQAAVCFTILIVPPFSKKKIPDETLLQIQCSTGHDDPCILFGMIESYFVITRWISQIIGHHARCYPSTFNSTIFFKKQKYVYMYMYIENLQWLGHCWWHCSVYLFVYSDCWVLKQCLYKDP